MNLGEVPHPDSRAEHPLAHMLDGLATAQADKLALSGAVPADDADPLPEEDLGAKRPDQAWKGELSHPQGDGPGPAQPTRWPSATRKETLSKRRRPPGKR